MPTMTRSKPAKKTKGPVSRSLPTGKSVKRVYFFGNAKAEGRAEMKELLGGKGANLADMTLVPLPVPPGFTITTDTCGDYNDAGQKLPRGLMEEVRANITKVEKATGKKFGDPKNPLLVAARAGNERFAYDSYRRLINMFGDTVMGVDHHHFEHELTAVKNGRGVKEDTDLDTAALQEVVRRYKAVYKQHVGSDFPSD